MAADALSSRVDERIDALSRLPVTALRDVKSFLGRTRSMDPATASAASVDSLVVAVVGGG